MNVSTTTEIGAYCSRSKHGASILDSVITIIIIIVIFNSSSSSSSSLEYFDSYSDDWYSND